MVEPGNAPLTGVAATNVAPATPQFAAQYSTRYPATEAPVTRTGASQFNAIEVVDAVEFNNCTLICALATGIPVTMTAGPRVLLAPYTARTRNV